MGRRAQGRAPGHGFRPERLRIRTRPRNSRPCTVPPRPALTTSAPAGGTDAPGRPWCVLMRPGACRPVRAATGRGSFDGAVQTKLCAAPKVSNHSLTTLPRRHTVLPAARWMSKCVQSLTAAASVGLAMLCCEEGQRGCACRQGIRMRLQPAAQRATTRVTEVAVRARPRRHVWQSRAPGSLAADAKLASTSRRAQCRQSSRVHLWRRTWSVSGAGLCASRQEAAWRGGGRARRS